MVQTDYDGPLVDAEQLGRLIRGARIICGFDTVDEAVAAVEERTGLRMTSRTFYALERGEQVITLEQMMAILMTLQPPGSIVFFERGLRQDVQDALARTRGDGVGAP